MLWSYAYTPMIWLSVASIMLLLGVMVYCFRQNRVPGALPLAIDCLFTVLWMAGSLLEITAVDFSAIVFWHKFQGAVILFVVTAFTCFILEYAWPGRLLTRRNLIILSIGPLLFLSVALLGDPGGLLWSGFRFDKGLITLRGPLNWLALTYAYLLGGLDFAILIYMFVHTPQQRWAAFLILFGHFMAFLTFLLEVIDPIIFHLPYASMGISFSFMMNAIVLFRFRILDPIPLARQTLVNQMTSGLVVLDSRQKIVTMNPAAEKILNTKNKDVKGRLITGLLPAYEIEGIPSKDKKLVEFSLASTDLTQDYHMLVSDLKDWHDIKVGELVLITNVTEKNKAQALILEQQRALAVLQEREHLARELHDDLVQVLAFISTQGQTVRRLLGRGDLVTADSHLERLVDVAGTVEADVRESIRGIRMTLSEKGLFATLEKFLMQYEQNYAIQTKLVRSESLSEDILSASVELQLLRIIQEALTNVRKHADASLVSIQFDTTDHTVCVSIKDNGKGFELFDGEIHPEGHFGLQMMRERIDTIGGSIRVSSQPGQGTEVLVCVPIAVKKTPS